MKKIMEITMTKQPDNVSSGSSTDTLDPTTALMRRKGYGPKESRRIIKNLFILGFTFTLLFSAFMGTANLQSSINSHGSLGIYSLATIYVSTIVASLFLPPLVMYKLKIKSTLALAICGYMVFIGSQFYPHFGTLIPAAAFLGVCTAHIWAAKSAYIAKIAEEYAALTGQPIESALQKFFGIFFLCFHSAQIWGNLISSSVLSQSDGEGMGGNESEVLDNSRCGPNFCPAMESHSANESSVPGPSGSKTNLLFGIFLGCSIAAAATVAIFLDSLVRYGENELKSKDKPKVTGLLIATVNHWKKPTQILIIPMSIWLGMQEAFIGADFTLAYISCAWGVHNIGYVMTCFGVCACISSLLIGKITYYVGRPVVFLAAGLINVGCMITMFTWIPTPDQYYVYFLISGLWGVADGVWSPQVKALYGAIFPDTAEAAFTNAGLWIALGFILVYLVGGMMCMSLKLAIYMMIVTFSILCYILIEIIERKRSHQLQSQGGKSVEHPAI